MGQPLSDVEFTKEFHRFQTRDKAKAFSLMESLERKENIIFDKVIEINGRKYKRYTKTAWRTSMNFKNRISFDIDTHDEGNLRIITEYYGKLFSTQFNVIKTMHGYHLISKKVYNSDFDWKYNVCRVLYPLLKVGDYRKYKYELDKFYKLRKEERDRKQLSRKELQSLTNDFEKRFIESGLYCGVGDFEILYAVNVLQRGFYSLRISKKNKSDYEEVIV